MKTLISLLGLLTVTVSAAATSRHQTPRARVLNGTYVGVRNEAYDQDFFLGIPYAQQPVGDLRFTVPQSLNETWQGKRDAKEYSDICVGYGTDSIWYPMSEACLTLNVIRGSDVNEFSKLPVGVWIHGGGFYMGSGSDQRYNMSRIIENAYKIDKPFIAVTFNYRLSAWGFLSSSQVSGSGNTNLGLRDQRMALQWIQENIHAFGGDPKKVTIWVNLPVGSYGGRDDRLFRGAIMESGGSISPGPANYTDYQTLYDSIVGRVDCSDAVDTLQCLREVPFEKLNSVLNGTDGSSQYNFGSVVDGDFLKNWGSVQLNNGQFVKVPIIAGTNTDEGTRDLGHRVSTRRSNGQQGIKLPSSVAKRILELYPDDPSQGIPSFLGDQRVPSMGYQWRRTSAYGGDYYMHANRRRQCEAWAEASVPAYCYRFNVRAADVPYIVGATHFEEVAFVFNNIEGLGYHYGKPFSGMPESYAELSTLMTSMWASFIHDLDPNTGVRKSFPNRWIPYAKGKPVDIVFDANTTSHMEPDTWRKDGIDYINSVTKAYWR
ncbi:hypothetical protein VTN00DRAFT_8226 [Thermoascus crustaceus]|uniref:uncharacterized protein n=1 Tax=Thermoascus crustaceus TaxID=5088 RepID=UPI0037440183